jgi:GGDEF domain-containing protein
LVSELTNAMAALPDVERVTEPIVALQNRLASAPPASELEPFRQAINETLAATRADVLGLKQGISDLISSSIARIKHADRESAGAAAAARAGAADQLTGLPTRASAEAEISKLYAQLPDSLLALFVVRRLQLINRKFGFSRGDQMLVRVVQHLARELESCGNLFRWTSSSFLAVAAPDAPVSHLRSKVQQMGLHRLTLTMEWEGRTALVPVSLDSRIISLSDHASADALCQALDATVLD